MGRTSSNKRAAKQASEVTSPRLDLTPFCDRSGRAPTFAQPWTQGGYTYASDLRVLIKIPSRAGEVSGESSFTASAEKMLLEHPAPVDGKFSPLPSLEGKTAWTTCRECHGSGAVLYVQDKPEICPSCNGEKRAANSKPITVGKRAIATRYLMLLATLPGIRIAAETGNAMDPLRFAFDGGEGLVMPLNVPK